MITPPIQDGQFVDGSVRIKRKILELIRKQYWQGSTVSSIVHFFEQNFRHFGTVEVSKDCLGYKVEFTPKEEEDEKHKATESIGPGLGEVQAP